MGCIKHQHVGGLFFLQSHYTFNEVVNSIIGLYRGDNAGLLYNWFTSDLSS